MAEIPKSISIFKSQCGWKYIFYDFHIILDEKP